MWFQSAHQVGPLKCLFVCFVYCVSSTGAYIAHIGAFGKEHPPSSGSEGSYRLGGTPTQLTAACGGRQRFHLGGWQEQQLQQQLQQQLVAVTVPVTAAVRIWEALKKMCRREAA